MALVKPDIYYHPCLKIDATDLVLCKTIPKAQIKYNFRRANYEDINKALSNIDWVKVFIGGTIDEVIGNFNVILDKIISSSVPESRSIGRSKFPIWYSSSLIHIIKDKLKAHKRWKTYRNPRDYDEFSLLRARQKLVSKKCFDMYEKSIQNNLSKDPKALWSYLRNKRQCSPGYPNTMILGDEVYYTEADACEGFNSFPSKWKEAHIIPIHKKGSRNKIEHYRPISILNSFGKLFEKLVNKTLSPLILRQLPQQQHGFTKNRSTVSNLTVFTEYILKGMDEGEQIDVIYTDFEKAIDRVDHVILLHKLLALGIRGDLHRWIKSYVTNRRQAVVTGGHRSTFINVTSGVPKGSILDTNVNNSQPSTAAEDIDFENIDIRTLLDIPITPDNTNQPQDTETQPDIIIPHQKQIQPTQSKTNKTTTDIIPKIDDAIDRQSKQFHIRKTPGDSYRIDDRSKGKIVIKDVWIPINNTREQIIQFLKEHTIPDRIFHCYFHHEEYFPIFCEAYKTIFKNRGPKLIKCMNRVTLIENIPEQKELIRR
ncbi:unnamed protein product [Pieris macdunnoughi]|uniref:Reverse transcriptase domain-containing protein n=1 Tax=Pieris macdunnoughi TaxID=345717 RepID=A0A821X058_9NEOP|nr:unnamed protein product [Pieris macdunnoughi]